MKHIVSTIIGLAALALAGPAPAQQPIVIKFSHVVALNTPKGKGAEEFKKLDLAAVKEPTEFLRTDARQAATLFPQNANVAATIALAGVGFERTEVSLNADPAAKGNTHLVEVEGPCGTMRIELSNKPFPDNPKTSMLAGLSLLRVIRNRSEAVQV